MNGNHEFNFEFYADISIDMNETRGWEQLNCRINQTKLTWLTFNEIFGCSTSGERAACKQSAWGKHEQANI